VFEWKWKSSLRAAFLFLGPVLEKIRKWLEGASQINM